MAQEAGRQPADERGRVRSRPRIRFASRGRGTFDRGFAVDDLGDVPQEPGIDAGALVEFIHVHAQPQGVGHGPQPSGVGDRQGLAQRGEPGLRFAGRGREAGAVDLQRAQRLVQRLLERAADRHGLADRLHLRPEQVARLREFVEREARQLDDHVVDGRLERGRRLARDVVRNLVQAIADRQLGGDLGDRKAGRLARQRGRTRYARVHLDHDQPARIRVDGELDVRAAGIHADLADDAQRGVAQQLIFLVGQGLGRRDRDRVAGMHAQRVEVLDGADDDHVVAGVAHDLQLELLPAGDRLLDQHFVRGRCLQPPVHDAHEFVRGLHDAAAHAPQGAGRAHDERQPQILTQRAGVFQRPGVAAAWQVQADTLHRGLEQVAVLGLLDGRQPGADEFHTGAVEHAGLGQFDRQIQAGLAADGRQQRIRAFRGDDLFQHRARERLDVGAVGEIRVGHDGRRVGVDQHDAKALLLERLARLRARVVELARLADDDRTGPDQEDGMQVGTFGHGGAARERAGIVVRIESAPSGR